MCNSNFIFKRRRFYNIRLQKMSSTWNLAHRSLKVIESGTIRKIVYGFLFVFFSNIVPKIFDFKTAVTLKTGLGVRQGHWKCHQAIEHIRLPIDIL